MLDDRLVVIAYDIDRVRVCRTPTIAVPFTSILR